MIPYFWLSIHLGYRCRDSGVCCSSGWPIPIERDRARDVHREMAQGRASPLVTPWLTEAPGAPVETAGMLAIRSDGHCVFHRPTTADVVRTAGCAIYPSRPSSCRHFPYVCAIDPRGVRVTLSHYCPTAADLLFTGREHAAVVEGPAVPGDGGLPEGLDARDALPPVAAGGRRLMTWDEVTAWEKDTISALVGSAHQIEVPDAELFDEAREAVADSLSWPLAPDRLEREWHVLVASEWPAFSAVVGRYLASKVFASWALYRGLGLPEVIRAIATARTVLGVEAARQCLHAGRPLDAALLKEAIRQSELLLVHYADPGL